jgi:hypothetical protein
MGGGRKKRKPSREDWEELRGSLIRMKGKNKERNKP